MYALRSGARSLLVGHFHEKGMGAGSPTHGLPTNHSSTVTGAHL